MRKTVTVIECDLCHLEHKPVGTNNGDDAKIIRHIEYDKHYVGVYRLDDICKSCSDKITGLLHSIDPHWLGEQQ